MVDTDGEHLPQFDAGLDRGIDHLMRAAGAGHDDVDALELRGYRLFGVVHCDWITPVDRFDEAIVPVLHDGVEGKKENLHCLNLVGAVVSS